MRKEFESLYEGIFSNLSKIIEMAMTKLNEKKELSFSITYGENGDGSIDYDCYDDQRPYILVENRHGEIFDMPVKRTFLKNGDIHVEIDDDDWGTMPLSYAINLSSLNVYKAIMLAE